MPKAPTHQPILEWWDPIFQTTKSKAEHVCAAAAKAGHPIPRCYGYQTSMDHVSRACVDLMHYDDRGLRDWLVDFLIAHADELGIEGIISNHRVMGFPSHGTWYRGPEAEWRPYSGPNPHTDHVHIHLNQQPFKGKPTSPKTSSSTPKPKKKPWSGNLWIIKDAPAYDKNGQRRPEHDLKKGTKIRGSVDGSTFNDGRYFLVGKKPNAYWYPLDSGNFSHDQDGQPIGEGGRPQVSLHAVRLAAKQDPGRKQGGTTKGAVDDVLVLEDALRKEGLLDAKYAGDGSYGSSTVQAYAAWQRKLGYTGKDADGIPGEESLKKLGAKYGFTVVPSE